MRDFEPLVPARIERWGAVAAAGLVALSFSAAWATAGPGSWVPARTLAAVRGEIPVTRLEPVVVIGRRQADGAPRVSATGDDSVQCAAGTARRPG